ncbi:MAG: hypothetical protein AAFX01_08005 [Cyanobacteria bacterium J06638_28]
MKRVLVITDDIQASDSCAMFLKRDKTIYVTAINLPQISAKRLSKSLRSLKRTDLIVLESDTHYADETTEATELLRSLQATGIPIVVLPTRANLDHEVNLRLVNWTTHTKSRPSLKALLAKIQNYPNSQEQVDSSGENVSSNQSVSQSVAKTQPLHQQVQQIVSPRKSSDALGAIRQIAHQLKEPLSNMNLAIHMLGQVQSLDDRDRYLTLLRQEYNRELQLLNQLDNYLQINLSSTS